MQKNERAKLFYKELLQNNSLKDSEFEIWSGSFNRKLRNAILAADEKEVVFLKYVFNYWQVTNQIRNTSVLDIIKVNKLMDQLNDFTREIMDEKG